MQGSETLPVIKRYFNNYNNRVSYFTFIILEVYIYKIVCRKSILLEILKSYGNISYYTYRHRTLVLKEHFTFQSKSTLFISRLVLAKGIICLHK